MTDSGTPSAVAREEEIKVLLVDDDEAWVQSTAQLLAQQRERLAVTTAVDLPDASATFAEVDPDCVVCDYELGGATGLELLSEVRDRTPDRPFILITGQGNETVASEAISQEVTDYIPKRSLRGRHDLLARRIESTVDSYRTERALARERRNKEAMLDILTETSSQEGLVRKFCEHLVRERDYECAWIGTTGHSNRVVPRAVAGEESYLDAAVEPDAAPGEHTEPAFVALAADELHVETDLPDPPAEHWQAAAVDHGFGSAAAVPLAHDGTVFGVLAVYRSTAEIDPVERGLLEEYGETIGYALRSANWKESLLSVAPVAVELALTDDRIPLLAVGRELPSDARIDVLVSVLREGSMLYHVQVDNATAEQLSDAAAAVDAVEHSTVTGTGPLRCELAVSLPTPETVVAEHGGQIAETVVDDGRMEMTVKQNEDSIQALVDGLDREYPTTVWAVRSAETVRSETTSTDLLDPLTEKQRRALELAYFNGYFERPRENDTTEVAAKLGVSRQTFTQHLRAGERKLFAGLLDPDG